MTNVIVALIGLAGIILTAIPAYRRTPRGRLGDMKHLDEFVRETQDEQVKETLTRELRWLANDYDMEAQDPFGTLTAFLFVYLVVSVLVLGFVVTFGSDLADPLNTTRGHLISLAGKASIYLLVLAVLSELLGTFARRMMRNPDSALAAVLASRNGPYPDHRPPDVDHVSDAAPDPGPVTEPGTDTALETPVEPPPAR